MFQRVLSERELGVVWRTLGLHRADGVKASYTDVAKEMGISRQRVTQLHDQVCVCMCVCVCVRARACVCGGVSVVARAMTPCRACDRACDTAA